MQLQSEKQKFGEILEDFSLRDLTGATVTLSDALVGKKGGVVVFWSGTCSHCTRYGPWLNSFERTHPGFSLIAVASRQGETLQEIRSVAAQQKLTFRILHDADSRIAKAWYTQQTPRAFLMDSSRNLLYRGAIDNFKFPGDPDYTPYLEPAIEQFLRNEPISKVETASFGCAIQSVYYIMPRAL